MMATYTVTFEVPPGQFDALCADTRLTDAAPDLLKALQDVLPYAIACIGIPRAIWPADSVILQAEAAIAKATGEKP